MTLSEFYKSRKVMISVALREGLRRTIEFHRAHMGEYVPGAAERL